MKIRKGNSRTINTGLGELTIVTKHTKVNDTIYEMAIEPISHVYTDLHHDARQSKYTFSLYKPCRDGKILLQSIQCQNTGSLVSKKV